MIPIQSSALRGMAKQRPRQKVGANFSEAATRAPFSTPDAIKELCADTRSRLRLRCRTACADLVRLLPRGAGRMQARGNWGVQPGRGRAE